MKVVKIQSGSKMYQMSFITDEQRFQRPTAKISYECDGDSLELDDDSQASYDEIVSDGNNKSCVLNAEKNWSMKAAYGCKILWLFKVRLMPHFSLMFSLSKS